MKIIILLSIKQVHVLEEIGSGCAKIKLQIYYRMSMQVQATMTKVKPELKTLR